MAKLNLYPCFKHWEKYDNIYIISDPHFGDIVTDEKGKDDYREANTGIKAPSIEEQVALINKKCHKNDLLIILGDIGDLEPIKKIKAGYKVLIMGNHDKGKSRYEKKLALRPVTEDDLTNISDKVIVSLDVPVGMDPGKWFSNLSVQMGIPSYMIYDFRRNLKNWRPVRMEDGELSLDIPTCQAVLDLNNKGLFDEVYSGALTIREDIVLSHELYDSKYCLNIHGHDHNCQFMQDLRKKGILTEGVSFFEKQLEACKTEKRFDINVCSEWVNYVPVNLRTIIDSGILKEIPDIHREAIDKQIENPIHSTVLN